MYRTNFYGQTAFQSSNAGNLAFPQTYFERLPQGPIAFARSRVTIKDGYSPKASAFEKTLHDEVASLSQRTKDLEAKLKNKQVDSLGPEEQQALMQEYSAIQRAKEMLSIIVDNMQKCTASIAANFR